METETQIPLGQNDEASREESNVVVDGTWFHLLMCWQSRMTRATLSAEISLIIQAPGWCMMRIMMSRVRKQGS